MNNIVYSYLYNSRFNIIRKKQKYNIINNYEFFAKNFDITIDKLIADQDLLRLEIHILAQVYLEKEKSHFITVMNNDNNNEKLDKTTKKESMVSD